MRINQAAEIHICVGDRIDVIEKRGLRVLTGIAKAETVGGAAEGEQTTFGFYCADEALEELADVLLNSELLRRGKELDDEIEETLGEVSDEALPRCARVGMIRMRM